MTRQFSIVDNTSILFGEDFIQWEIHFDDVFRIKHGRNLVTFNEVNVRVLDLLYDYDLTEHEETQINRYLWFYFFGVFPSR